MKTPDLIQDFGPACLPLFVLMLILFFVKIIEFDFGDILNDLWRRLDTRSYAPGPARARNGKRKKKARARQARARSIGREPRS